MDRIFLVQKSLILLILAMGMNQAYAQPQPIDYDKLSEVNSSPLKFQLDGYRYKRIDLEAEEHFFDVPDSKRNDRIWVVVLRDPKTGLSWWGCNDIFDSERSFPKSSAYLSDQAIGYVRLGLSAGRETLWLRESTEKYPSFAEATAHALPQFMQVGMDVVKKGCHILSHEADIASLASKAFFYGQTEGSPARFVAKVVEVHKNGRDWQVLLSGADGSKMLLAVDDHYQARQANLWQQVAKHDTTLPIGEGGNKTRLQAALLAFTNIMADDKKPFVKVLILRDPKTGLTWWACQESADVNTDDAAIAKYLSRYRVYLSNDTLGAVLLTIRPNALWLRESKDKYPTMAEAKTHALQAFAQFMPEILERGSDTLFHEDNLYGRHKFEFSISSANDISTDQVDKLFHKADLSFLVVPEFFYGDTTAENRKLFAKLESVQKVGDDWRITLSGTNNSRAEVDIGGQYEIDKVVYYP